MYGRSRIQGDNINSMNDSFIPLGKSGDRKMRVSLFSSIVIFFYNLLVYDLGFQCRQKNVVYLASGKPLNGPAVAGLIIGVAIMFFGLNGLWRLHLQAAGRGGD